MYAASSVRSEHRLDELEPVHHPERDLLAGPHAEPDEALRQSVDPCRQLGEAPALSLEVERFARSPALGRALGQRSESLLRKPVPHVYLRA
jgi:hypothetical protein